jgi:hypothetical protein
VLHKTGGRSSGEGNPARQGNIFQPEQIRNLKFACVGSLIGLTPARVHDVET